MITFLVPMERFFNEKVLNFNVFELYLNKTQASKTKRHLNTGMWFLNRVRNAEVGLDRNVSTAVWNLSVRTSFQIAGVYTQRTPLSADSLGLSALMIG